MPTDADQRANEIRVVGAGPPRTGTASLTAALELLLDGPCYHMREIPDHPFDLGPGWRAALTGAKPDWDRLLAGYRASVDWPASLFWEPLSDHFGDAIVLLSRRASAAEWVASLNETVLPAAREATAPGWSNGRDLVDLFERFTGTDRWDDPAVLASSYERHLATVRRAVPASRLVDWQPADGWDPICRALQVPVPREPFPWLNRREDWA
jgi:Sulfotransferase domain